MSGEIKLNAPSGGSVTLVAEDRVDDTTFLLSGDGMQGIENGSNANGTYTKFPDGTLICRGIVEMGACNVAKGSIYESAAVLWTFPVAFIGEAPTTSGSGTSASLWNNCAKSGEGLTQANIKTHAGNNIWTSDTLAVTAIGRWK